MELTLALGEALTLLKEELNQLKSQTSKKLTSKEAEFHQMQQKLSSLKDSFDHFSLKVLKPAQLNEARLFSAETRLKEEERRRITDQHHTRETLKKLIYAIQQFNLNQIGKAIVEGPRSDDENSLKMLPSLLQLGRRRNSSKLLHKTNKDLEQSFERAFNDNAPASLGPLSHKQNETVGETGFRISQSNQINQSNQSNLVHQSSFASPNSPQILFMKRLNFLKSNIDQSKRPLTTSNKFHVRRFFFEFI